jgi:TatD DNase family protein
VKFVNVHGHHVNPHKDEIVIQNVFPGEKTKLEAGSFCSMGLHPWHIENDTMAELMKILENEVQGKEFVAIGETGLDKMCETSFALQKTVFEKHFQISEAIEKPLIIHCVKAFNELIQLKKKWEPKVPWMVHGFNSKPEVAEMLLRQNVFLSFGKAIVYPLSNASRVLAHIPNDRFLLETDDSDYTTKEIYQIASVIKKIEMDDLKSIVLQNVKNCFGI